MTIPKLFIFLGIGVVVLIPVLMTFLMALFVVTQQSAAVIQRFGKFLRIATAGLNFKVPWIDYVVGEVNLRIQQLDVQVETKTYDDVFVDVTVSVQYFVRPEKVFEAFYKLEDPKKQINSYIFDVVRARVPEMKLDEVFGKKDEIADTIKKNLAEVMEAFGYGITQALVTNIDPDKKVKAAMNEINAAQRLRLAATEKGEAERIMRVKNAEGEAESKKLQGEGIANQRKAIVEGLRESVSQFQEGVPGTSAQDVMNLVLMTQFFDTVKDVGAASKSNAILIPYSPGALSEIADQIRNAVIVANQVDQAATSKKSTPDKSTGEETKKE